MTIDKRSANSLPIRVTVAVSLAVVGMLIAVLNLVAEGAGASWLWWAASKEDVPGNWFLNYLTVRTLVGIALLTATLWLTIDVALSRRRDSTRNARSAQVKLAVLLFAYAPLWIGALLTSMFTGVDIRMTVLETVRPPGWVPVAEMVSLASSALLAMLGLICGALLVSGRRRSATRSNAAPRIAPAARPPAVLGAGLGIVGLGVVFAVLELFVNAAGGYGMLRERGMHDELVPSDPTSITMLSLLVLRVLLGAGLVVGAVVLLRRAQRGSDSGRAGLAVLMFCCVPITILAGLSTLPPLRYALTVELDILGLSGWIRPALYTSLAANGLLLVMALLAGSLLVLPASRRFTAGPQRSET